MSIALESPHSIDVPRRLPRHVLRFSLLAIAAAGLLLAELSIGVVAVPLQAVLGALAGQPTDPVIWSKVVIEFRLPRALNAIASGAALGTAGVMLQTLFRNPLADPFVLGVVQAARLGAAILVVATGLAGNAYVIRFGFAGDIGLAAASIAGCVGMLLLLSVLARRVSTVTLLISGLMFGYFSVGLISALLHFVDEHQARAFRAWDDASFAGVTWQQLQVLLPGVVAGICGIMFFAKSLNALLLGEAYASTLGVAVGRVKILVLFATAWLCGLVTAFCGPVAFLGLVAAQLARGTFHSSDHRLLLPGAALLGACVALTADLVAHLPLPHHVFHLNAVIGLVGAPIALLVLLRTRALRNFET